jgi:hypothetical protein
MVDMRRDGMSVRAISNAVGASVGAVHGVVSEVFKNEHLTVNGADGKTYPAQQQPKAAPLFVAAFGRKPAGDDQPLYRRSTLADDTTGKLTSLPGHIKRPARWTLDGSAHRAYQRKYEDCST